MKIEKISKKIAEKSFASIVKNIKKEKKKGSSINEIKNALLENEKLIVRSIKEECEKQLQKSVKKNKLGQEAIGLNTKIELETEDPTITLLSQNANRVIDIMNEGLLLTSLGKSKEASAKFKQTSAIINTMSIEAVEDNSNDKIVF